MLVKSSRFYIWLAFVAAVVLGVAADTQFLGTHDSNLQETQIAKSITPRSPADTDDDGWTTVGKKGKQNAAPAPPSAPTTPLGIQPDANLLNSKPGGQGPVVYHSHLKFGGNIDNMSDADQAKLTYDAHAEMTAHAKANNLEAPSAMSSVKVGNELHFSSSIKKAPNGPGFMLSHLPPNSPVAKDCVDHNKGGKCGEMVATAAYHQSQGITDEAATVPAGGKVVTMVKIGNEDPKIHNPCGAKEGDTGCHQMVNNQNLIAIPKKTTASATSTPDILQNHGHQSTEQSPTLAPNNGKGKKAPNNKKVARQFQA